MERKQTKLWKTKDGIEIRICDMSDEHLCNTIKMLVRHGSMRLLALALHGYTYAEDAPEMAAMAAEQGAEELMDAVYANDYSAYCDAWECFELEAERRGIELAFANGLQISKVECWRHGVML